MSYELHFKLNHQYDQLSKAWQAASDGLIDHPHASDATFGKIERVDGELAFSVLGQTLPITVRPIIVEMNLVRLEVALRRPDSEPGHQPLGRWYFDGRSLYSEPLATVSHFIVGTGVNSREDLLATLAYAAISSDVFEPGKH